MADVTGQPSSSTTVRVDGRHQFLDSLKKAAFVIGTALITFIALRNTITWHVQRFWGASGDFWQSLWFVIYCWFGGDKFSMGFYGTAIVTSGTFWVLNLFLLYVDYTGRPSWVLRYKVQDTQNVPIDHGRLRSALIRVMFNQTVVAAPVMYLAYRLMVWRSCNFSSELPTFSWVVYELFVMIWVEEIGFYYSHRLMHHPRIYKHIHKVHHEWTSPIGIVSLYAHPLEHVVSNLIPPLLGPLVVGSHIATAWMWYALALTSTTIAHCGYHFPFLPSPEAHDFHHLKFNQNYGVLGVLDRLHGTDSIFRNSKAYDRHFLSLSLVPVKQLIPDDPKKKEK
jgi:methylsterol monooxygenase